MACKTTFELHHNFPKLAEESGFTFNTHKPKVHIEWRKIKLIDIENLIRDRKFAIVEQHINDILDCVLESEFDVRILDEGFLKIFRLAQLAVEYQQFCRHYLDRSVLVLREEVTKLMQELDSTKRNLREKEEEIKKIRKKSKHFVRTPLPYGNENIAAMILKTLNQSKGDIFNSTSQLDAIQYNKCGYCEKVFLNQLYLKGHISRRHGDVLDIPQRDITDNNPTVDHTNEKLNNEVSELKLKLKQMEDFIENSRNFTTTSTEQATPAEVDTLNVNNKESSKIVNKDTKDAEVLTNEEGLILEKIEQWKKEEHDKYNEEIKLLRQQIIDIISNKEKQDQTAVKNELKMIEELHSTIKLQGDEILTLKHKLLNEENIQVEKRKEIEAQMSYWVKQAEMQSTEYKLLLQKLNEVANEAKEYRAQAHAEKEKAENFQLLLQRHQNNTSSEHSHTKHKNKANETPQEKAEVEHEPVKTKNTQRSLTADVITLKKLQQKAQELLNLDQSSSSDNSNTSDVKFKPKNKHNKEEDIVRNKNKQIYDNKYNKTILPRSKGNSQSYDKNDDVDKKNREESKFKNKSKPDSHPSRKENGVVHIPASPIKVVRAKITEEVNNRLISLGVDPLKNRIPQNIFRKQRKLLQEQQQAKTKKVPSREKILHSIMTHLDQNTTPSNYSHGSQAAYVSPNKFAKSFSLSSVLSNVKSKALSLVKSNEGSNKNIKSHDELTKTAMALLKTPPDSANSSPIKQRRSSVTLSDNNILDISEEKKSTIRQKSIKNNNKKHEESSEESTESSEESEHNRNSEDKQKLDRTSKIINSLINSPARRPDNNINGNHAKYKSEYISPSKTENVLRECSEKNFFFMDKDKNSSDGVESIKDTSPEKNASFENIASPKHTKGVLKNASSTSSLNKKKVLFDMDAIQMKSVSASPSQSITDKSDKNEQYELGIVNLDTEEWDISSIENEPLKSTTKIQISRTSPKIAELKQTIESQLTRRNPKLSTTIIGGVDVLTTPIQKASFGGSNTSLGSSILDDDSAPITNHNAFIKPKKITEKDDSEIEISDLIADTIVNKSYNKSF